MPTGGIIIFASIIAFAAIVGWCRVGARGRDLTDEQIIERGDQRLADLIHGDVR